MQETKTTLFHYFIFICYASKVSITGTQVLITIWVCVWVGGEGVSTMVAETLEARKDSCMKH